MDEIDSFFMNSILQDDKIIWRETTKMQVPDDFLLEIESPEEIAGANRKRQAFVQERYQI